MPLTIDALEGVDTVLLDVGGVLYVDPWETILLSPTRPAEGLAVLLNVDLDTARAAGEAVWPEFATRTTSEAEYWSRLSTELGIDVPDQLAAELSQRLLRPLPQAESIIDTAATRRLGVITDNTTFWYQRQKQDLDLEGRIDSDLEFVSSVVGRTKRGRPSLFALAAEAVDAERTLVVDDRADNLRVAAGYGFRTLHLP